MKRISEITFFLVALAFGGVHGECDKCNTNNPVACHSETVYSLCINDQPTMNFVTCPTDYICTSNVYVCYPSNSSVASCTNSTIDESSQCGICASRNNLYACLNDTTIAFCFTDGVPHYESLSYCPAGTVCDLNAESGFCTAATKTTASCRQSQWTTPEPTTTTTSASTSDTTPVAITTTTPVPTTTTTLVRTTTTTPVPTTTTTPAPTTATTLVPTTTTTPVPITTTTPIPITTTTPVPTTTTTPVPTTTTNPAPTTTTTPVPSTTTTPVSTTTTTPIPATTTTPVSTTMTTPVPTTTTTPVPTTATTPVPTTTTTPAPTTSTTPAPTTTTTTVPTTTTTPVPTTTTTPAATTEHDLTPAEICENYGASGTIAYPGDLTCKMSIRCSQTNNVWNAVVNTCPTNQWFDPTLKFCTTTYSCPTQSTSTTTTTTTTTVATTITTPAPTTTTAPVTTTTTTTVATTTTTPATTTEHDLTPAAICENYGASGTIAYPGDLTCKMSIRCSQTNNVWNAVVNTCPMNQWFDPTLKFCTTTYSCPTQSTLTTTTTTTTPDPTTTTAAPLTLEEICQDHGKADTIAAPNDTTCTKYIVCSKPGASWIAQEYTCKVTFDPTTKKCSTTYVCPT